MLFKRKAPEKTPLDPRLVREKLRHIAFIMDGNGRYATRRGLPRESGHIEGAKNFRRVIEHCADLGIETVTVYAFSTENWSRPEREVSALVDLFFEYVDLGLETCKKKDLRVIFLGDKSRYPSALREKAEALEETTKDCSRTLNVALNYGSRAEIVRAANSLIAEGKTEITEEELSDRLFTRLSPDPDLVVRTAGEYRISNFLLWQSAYAEFYFTDTLWPELSAGEIDDIVRNFLSRKRTYGNVI